MDIRRRIHFISTNPAPWGGSEELWHRLALRALDEGNEVLVSVFRQRDVPEKIRILEKKGAIIDSRHPPGYHFDQPFLKLIITQLLDRLNWNRYACAWWHTIRFRSDIMLISSGESLDGYLFDDSFPIKDAIKRKKPYIFISHFHHEHSKILTGPDRKRKQLFFKNAAASFFVSWRNLQMAINELQYRPPSARIIHNPLVIPETTATSISTGKIRMAFVARLDCEIKCQDIVVNALAHESFGEFEFVLDLFGEGKDLDYLRELIAFHGLGDRVRLMGHHPNPLEIWNDHEILVLTSRGEGTPLTIFEAMRAGRTAIVTNTGDSALWINEERGYVSPASTMESIRDTLMRAMKDRISWENKGESCRNFFLEKWQNRHIADIYGALVGENSPKEIGFNPETYLSYLEN
jgi:glycosyltransferase involved in cell wall biosynthesis